MEQVGKHQPYPLPSHPHLYNFSWDTGRILPEYQLVYIAAGEGEFESHDTGRIAIRAGMAMLLMPDVWHRYRPNPKVGWIEYWVSFNGQLPHLWQKAGMISPATPVLAIKRIRIGDQALVHRLDRIVRTVVTKPQNGVAVSLFAQGVLANIFSRAAQRADALSRKTVSPAFNQSQDPTLHAALHLIWNHSHRDLSVGDITGQLGVTRRTLERRFQALRNSTVMEEMTTCRIARAKRLLRETHLPIKRVAFASGFSTPAYMATVFRRKLKTTPQHFRSGRSD